MYVISEVLRYPPSVNQCHIILITDSFMFLRV